MKKSIKYLFASVFINLVFVIWTIAVAVFDVKCIGAGNTPVGFASMNKWFHELTGVHYDLYILTDWLSLIALGICFSFGLLGLIQWKIRKDILKVDLSILALGVFYVIVLFCFIFFEFCIINYRPVLIDGVIEPSYPSSTTMLVLCVMLTALYQINERVKNKYIKSFMRTFIILYILFMFTCRLISGVHWISDIIGGVILSVGLVLLYISSVSIINENN